MSDVKKTQYYDEKLVSHLVLTWKEEKNPLDYEMICENIMNVARGVIFKHGYHKQLPFDQCFSIAVTACTSALPRFDPEKGTSFNYFSLTARRAIVYYLIKLKRVRMKEKPMTLPWDDEILQGENVVSPTYQPTFWMEVADLEKMSKNLTDVSTHVAAIVISTIKAAERWNKREVLYVLKKNGYSHQHLRRLTKIWKERSSE